MRMPKTGRADLSICQPFSVSHSSLRRRGTEAPQLQLRHDRAGHSSDRRTAVSLYRRVTSERRETRHGVYPHNKCSHEKF